MTSVGQGRKLAIESIEAIPVTVPIEAPILTAFGSLAVSDHRGLASMGLLLTIAISWSLVCSLLILPRMLALAAPHRGAGP